MDNYELAKSTPMMKQWYDIKQTLGDEIVFCRVGDFYELFYDDAVIASKALDLVLTKRKIGDGHYPMAGVPHRSLENYVARLINKGFKVAVIDQLEDAKQAKGKKTIKRGLTRIVTKGTLTEESMLTPGKNNYLASLFYRKTGKKYEIGLAICDLSTGDFRAGSFNRDQQNEFLRAYTKFSPVEVIYDEKIENPSDVFGIKFENDELISTQSSFWFELSYAREIIYNQFKVKTAKGFGLNDDSPAIQASGALIKYLIDTQFTEFPHISVIKSFDVHETMTLDVTAIRGLELFQNSQDQSSHATLIELMDETVTNQGGRLLRHWMANPLGNKTHLRQRLSAVNVFLEDSLLQHNIRSILSEIGDIERLITRISMGTARPDELIKLAFSLERIPAIKEKLTPLQSKFPVNLIASTDPCIDIIHLIKKSIYENPSSHVGDGNVINEDYNSELDRLRIILNEGKSWLDNFVKKEMKKTGISSLKIKQNNVWGYFLEISNKDQDKIPEYYIKKQSMVNVERYFSEELKNWEIEVIDAEIKISELEERIYKGILNQLSHYVSPLQITSQAIAQIDCLSSFAYLAERRDYCKPTINNGISLKIEGVRHPVIEVLNPTQEYVPNDIILNYDKQRIMIITGPNYSGKSSLLRATALTVIMAQMGSYVPAKSVDMGIIDRIFTRIGASDNLVAGQSTFMLEMADAANLVNNSTDRSLIIADELGRGTSTYDGLAIAWSIVEHLHNNSSPPKTMIATHYHQLAELESILDACKNYQFVIRFEKGKPIFNHKLERGSSDKSFGVEVAKLSGLPDTVINRGRQILEILERKAGRVTDQDSKPRLVDLISAIDGQASLENWFEDGFLPKQKRSSKPKPDIEQIPHPLLKELEDLDLESLTPVEALNLLVKYKEQIP